MRRASAAAVHASSALCAPKHVMQAASAYVLDASAYVAAERKALMAAALGWASWPIAVAARPITVRAGTSSPHIGEVSFVVALEGLCCAFCS